jgi:hypothetical protein
MNIFINNRYRKLYKTIEGTFYVIYKKKNLNITNYFKKNGVIKKEYKHLIQQKSKKIGGTDNKLVLCSFNVYTWEGYKSYPYTFDTNFKKLINDNNVELLLTQEDDIEDNDDTNESVKAYSIGNQSKRFQFNSCINSHNEGNLQFYKGVVPRNAIIIKDNEFGINIANLHLEGGRFVDLELDNDKFQIYLDIKVGLLKKVLNLTPAPDIILGDFNSVYCNDEILLKKMHDDQFKYYKVYRNNELLKIKKEENSPINPFSLHMRTSYGLNLIKKCAHRDSNNKTLSLEHVISWNNAPFALLKAHGYIYIEPNNIKVSDPRTDIDIINPTSSRGKNVIDHVWVKDALNSKYTFSTEIYDLGEEVSSFYGNVSDHKPIILTIEKNILTKKRKYSNSLNDSANNK